MAARFLSTAFVMLATMATIAPPAIAGGVDVQSPCTPTGDSCLVFNSANPTNTLRSYSFKRPKSGQALVTFDGVITCINGSTGLVNMFVDGQIVTDANATPGFQQPGGARIVQSVVASSGLTAGVASFVFSVSRKIPYKGGVSKTIHFRTNSLAHPATVECQLKNAAFSAVFTK